jgi:hypothetical protein
MGSIINPYPGPSSTTEKDSDYLKDGNVTCNYLLNLPIVLSYK